MGRTIPLTRGYVVIVDDNDYEWLSRRNWYALGVHPNVYAARKKRKAEGGPGIVLMHRVVAQAEDGDFVDHKNHDGLDNRRVNLRVCPQGLNLANQRSSTGGSCFKGVYWNRERKRWVAQIGVNGVKRRLGRYLSEEAAARAYDRAASEVWGDYANLNFPD